MKTMDRYNKPRLVELSLIDLAGIHQEITTETPRVHKLLREEMVLNKYSEHDGVFLVAERYGEKVYSNIDPINGALMIAVDVDRVSDFIVTSGMDLFVVMEFKTISEAVMVMHYFNEGHPLNGEYLLTERDARKRDGVHMN